MKIRIKFRKYGVMKFIGHLDIMRYFQKAIRRAEIPIAYSTGFSPHQIMSFAAPLGVGLCSNGEYLDIVCNEPLSMSGEQMKDALNMVMVEGIDIVSVRALPKDAGNAMASVAAARYTVCFREGCEPSFDWVSQVSEFYNQLTIPVIKKTKKSTKELDLKPAIYELSVEELSGKPVVEMLVDASSGGNIKPSLVMEAFLRQNGQEELAEAALLVTREDTYGDRGSAEHHRFVPLEDFGEIF